MWVSISTDTVSKPNFVQIGVDLTWNDPVSWLVQTTAFSMQPQCLYNMYHTAQFWTLGVHTSLYQHRERALVTQWCTSSYLKMKMVWLMFTMFYFFVDVFHDYLFVQKWTQSLIPFLISFWMKVAIVKLSATSLSTRWLHSSYKQRCKCAMSGRNWIARRSGSCQTKQYNQQIKHKMGCL